MYVANDPVNAIDQTGTEGEAIQFVAFATTALGPGIIGAVSGALTAAYGVTRLAALAVPVAVAILSVAYIEDSALQHEDPIDDEGPGEGGPPDTIDEGDGPDTIPDGGGKGPDSQPDGGTCGGPILPPALPDNERPTIPVPPMIDPLRPDQRGRSGGSHTIWQVTACDAWRQYNQHFEAALDASTGLVELDNTAVSDEAFNWDWTLPSLSIVLQAFEGSDVRAIIKPRKHRWQPFDPSVPTELPDLGAYGVRYRW